MINIVILETYVKKFFKLFPCHELEKTPITDYGLGFINGHLDATDDWELIKRTIRKYPNCNWGAVPPSNVFILDLDKKKGKDGFKTLVEKGIPISSIADTINVKTPSGGGHFYFECDKITPCGADVGGSGVDVKNSNGYILIVGSKISINEEVKEYEFVRSFDDCEFKKCPDFIYNLLKFEEKKEQEKGEAVAEREDEDFTEVVKVHLDIIEKKLTEQYSHELLMKIAKLLGGFVGGGQINSEVAIKKLLEIMERVKPCDYKTEKERRKKISDGVNFGKDYPIFPKVNNNNLNDRFYKEFKPSVKNPTKINFMSFAELEKIALERLPTHLVRELLIAGEVCMVYGSPWAGKSTILAKLMADLSQKTDFFGFDTIETPVVYLNCDQGSHALIYNRIVPHIKNRDLLSKNLLMPVFEEIPSPISNEYPKTLIEEAKKIMVASKIGVLVIDTMRTAFISGMDSGGENDSACIMSFLPNLKKLANEFGWAIVLLHHANKGDGNYAGSSSIAGQVDCFWELSREIDSNLSVLKVNNRHGFHHEFAIERDDEGNLEKGINLTDNDRIFLAKIPKFPKTISLDDLAKYFDKSHKTIKNTFSLLRNKGVRFINNDGLWSLE